MNTNNCILMIFEGEKTEKVIFDSLKQYFLNENDKTIVYGFHCSEIYSLYNKLKRDSDLELFYLLKDKLKDRNEELQSIEFKNVSEMYLFFDYDGHAPTAKHEILEEMLEIFDNETEQGKLYISYPMVEAIRHLKEDVDFISTVVESSPDYKVISKDCDDCFKSFKTLSFDSWLKIIEEHVKKANYIVNDTFECSKLDIIQQEILENQKEKFITTENKVAVLSSFALFLRDYYGYSQIDRFLAEGKK